MFRHMVKLRTSLSPDWSDRLKPLSGLFLVIVSLCLDACGARAAQSTGAVPADIAQLEWLEGTWIGGGQSTTIEERWTPAAGGAMLGISRTIAKGRMAAFEFLRIVSRDGTLIYIAQPGGRPPTEFRLTALTPESVTFENPAHDFPKLIRYNLKSDGTLEARVGDHARSQSYEFRRQK